MKALIALSLLAIATAHADPIGLHAVRKQASEPEVRGSWRDCATSAKERLAVTHTLTVASTTVKALQECGPKANLQLAIKTAAGWFIERGAVIRDDRPTQTSLREVVDRNQDDVLSAGSFADGTPAIVHSQATKTTHQLPPDAANRDPRIVSVTITQNVTICRVRDGVQCGQVSFTCPSSGCGVVKLDRGAMTVSQLVVEQRTYTIEP